MSQLPSTCTSTDTELTPNTLLRVTDPSNLRQIWGRLFPTLKCLSAYDLERQTFKLGKNENCDCVLTDDTFINTRLSNISREHFMIVKEPDKPAYIKDLSKNGTFLNKDKIGRNRTRILQNDDEIAIGYRDLKVFIFKTFESRCDNFLPITLQRKYYASRFLGRGAFGEVRLIFDKATRRPYALKKILKGRSSRGRNMKNILATQKEIDILKNFCDHPLIVSVYDVEETPEAFFIAMEYMAGGQLTDLIVSERLTETQVKYFFYQIVVAVEYLHGEGIIHRDLKADNVLLMDQNNLNTIVKVSDFGLSKILEEESLASTKCGTPYYVAPEVIDPTRPRYDRKVDVWSLGVLLFFMLSQKLPFVGDNSATINKLILKGKYSMTDDAWEDISDAGQDLIRRLLTVSPDYRINLEDISEHAWIKNDDWVLRKVDDLVLEMSTTCDYDSEETVIAPSAKRIKMDEDDDDTH